LTDEEKLAQDIAEKILFSHASDIENLTVWEMTADYVQYHDNPEIQTTYGNEVHYERLTEAVHAKVDSAVIGISWNEGKTWEW
jgi:hypothetical protein